MIELNISATTPEHKILKEHLESMISKTLADKINNGVPIEKDGKQLISKKDFNTFMEFACKQAQEQAEKGARAAFVEDNTVLSWAIHYFEEDSIEGKLFNEDGTEYKPPKSVSLPASKSTYIPAEPKPKPQFSFFDVIDSQQDNDPPEPEQAESVEPEPEQADLFHPESEHEPGGDKQQCELTYYDETYLIDGDGVLHKKEENTRLAEAPELETLKRLIDNFIVRLI